MYKKQIGQVELYTNSAVGFSKEALVLADKVKDCYLQKPLIKGCSYPMTNKDGEDIEVPNTDYVEGIIIDDDKHTVYWTQGDDGVLANIKDIEVKNLGIDNLEQDYGSNVVIEVRPNAIVVEQFRRNYYICKTDETGFISANFVENKTLKQEALIILPDDCVARKYQDYNDLVYGQLTQVEFRKHTLIKVDALETLPKREQLRYFKDSIYNEQDVVVFCGKHNTEFKFKYYIFVR